VKALELDGIEKAFGANTVLRGVSFSVDAGHVHAVLGENGAGKSTLMKILLGVETADGGAMRLGGRAYRPAGPADARRSGVVMVPQERTLCPHLDVVENVTLGVEPVSGPFVRRGEARAAALDALTLVTGSASRIPLDARAADLPVADQQLVEIARALAQAGETAKILVLDEPTSSLGQDDAARLFTRVAALKETGLAILLVTHFLADVRAHADRYTVLRDGKVQGDGDARETAPETIVHQMLGRELEGARADAARDGARGEGAPGGEDAEVLLEVRALAGREKPARASFVLRKGEVLGLAGLVGSGRTELLRAILGLDRARSGEVRVKANAKGVGLLSEDRGGEGLMLARSIADNVSLTRGGPRIVRPSEARAEAARWIDRLEIKSRGPEQPAGELSGGNQQKVQIARLLREDYDVLLVDEPTRGIDVAAKAQVLELLRELAANGKGIVLVSSQLDELVTTCDRIAVLKDGVLGEPRPASEWTEESLLLEAAS
jgi:ribose transport system ATP-binding protein